jgi:hypothetical protein
MNAKMASSSSQPLEVVENMCVLICIFMVPRIGKILKVACDYPLGYYSLTSIKNKNPTCLEFGGLILL